MRKIILLALAGYAWKKFQAKAARPRIVTDLSSNPASPQQVS
jgi:hypothetical protein